MRRDRITFDVFSPLTVGRMMVGSERMRQMHEKTQRHVETVTISGADLKRVLLKTGQKFYRSAIHMYLLEKVVARVEGAIARGAATLREALAASPEAVFSEQWVDIGGHMMPRGRLDQLCRAVEEGLIADLDALNAAWDQILAAYADDEWAWVRWAYGRIFAKPLDDATPEILAEVADQLSQARVKFLNLVLLDANKEFNAAVQVGFGHDGDGGDTAADSAAVRGDCASNKFVQQLQSEIASLANRGAQFKQALTRFAA